MRRRRPIRRIPYRYDDNFRGGIAFGAAVAGLLVLSTLGDFEVIAVAIAACAALSGGFLGYLVWTHLVFAGAPPERSHRIAAEQHHRGLSTLSRVLGFGGTQSWAISAAVAALMGAVTAAVLGARDGGAILTSVALATAAVAWVTVVYAFGLSYFRLHAAGERFNFDLDDEPRFVDFISMALMISAGGALSAASPTTRTGLGAVRTHTVIAFVFNALVIAMTVSLLAGLIASVGGR